jgi:tetratricopeptide (TPR) repeat protein
LEENGKAYYRLAEAHFEMKKYQKADQNIKTALKLINSDQNGIILLFKFIF